MATAKDRPRAIAGIVGGLAGGALGSVGGPVGEIAGQAAGEAGSKWLYDHHDELARKAADTLQWMKDRTAGLAAQAAHGFDAGLPPYNGSLY